MTEQTETKPKNQLKNHSFCDCCSKNDGIILMCDGCICSFHLTCAYPPIAPDEIPDKEWYCKSCQERLGISKPSVRSNDPFAPIYSSLVGDNPIQFDVPKYISKNTEYDVQKKQTKYSRDLCECCEQKGVHVKCSQPGCNRAFHLMCHDPPLFAIPKIFFCETHAPKKEKIECFEKPTSTVYLHDEVDFAFTSPLAPLVKLGEKLKK